MSLSPQQATERLQELQAEAEQFQHLYEFRSRLEVLEAHLGAALERNIRLEDQYAELSAKLTQRNNESLFYKLMLQTIEENPTLQPLWDELLMSMKLCDSEIEDKFKAINDGAIV